MRTAILTGLLLSLSSSFVLADKATDERLANAATAFGEIMSAPDKGIPGDVLNKAACVVVVPGMKKGGFIVGGSFGRGSISCRGAGNWDGERRRWSNWAAAASASRSAQKRLTS